LKFTAIRLDLGGNTILCAWVTATASVYFHILYITRIYKLA